MFIFYKINKYIKLCPQSNKSKSLILSDSLKSAVIKIQQKVCCEVGCVRRCKPHPLNVTHLSVVSFPQTTSRSQTVKSRQRQMNTTLWSNQGCFIWKTQKTHLCSVSYISDPKNFLQYLWLSFITPPWVMWFLPTWTKANGGWLQVKRVCFTFKREKSHYLWFCTIELAYFKRGLRWV